MLVESAFAKINLFLDVLSKRDDGFHNIRSVMCSVSLCDTLTLTVFDSDHIDIRLRISGSDLPMDSSNLVYRAAEIYLRRACLAAALDITLDKRIPVEAGLGGGSSDAAATLRALNRYFSAFDEEGLNALALELGSDVPFCLTGGVALCEGRGELITKIPDCKKMYFAIAIGNDRVSTPEAYRTLDEYFSYFDGSKASGGEVRFRSFCMEYTSNGLSGASLYNIFEETVENVTNSVAEIKNELFKLGAAASLMSGSGPSAFGIFHSSHEARAAVAALSDLGYRAFYAESVM